MAIKEFITLEGVQEVEAQLKKLAATGEQSLEQFRKPLPDMKLPEIDSKPIEEASGHVVKLTEVLHTLRPILQAAGLQFSEFGALTRLAGTSLLALAAATGGAIVVALAKLEENATRTKGVLADLFGSSTKGDQAFANLDKQAKQFGTTVEGLAPGLESFQQALNSIDRTAQGFRALKEEDLPGAQLAKNADAVTEAYGNFIKLLRAGQLDQDQAEKSAKAFFDTLKEGGTVTSAALRNLPAGTINLLKEAFGEAGATTRQFFALVDSGAISVDNLQRTLNNFGPQAQQAFDTKAVKSFSDEFGKILGVLREGFKSLSGGTGFSDFIIGELKRIRDGISSTITDLTRLKQLFDFFQSLGQKSFQASVGAAQQSIIDARKSQQGFDEAGFIAFADTIKTKFIPNSVDASNSIQKLGASALSAGQIATKAVDGISASLQAMRDKAKETGEEMQSVIVGGTEFKGRLDQIRVSRPQLAGEFDPVEEAVKQADAAAKATKAAFINNPFFKAGIPIAITPEVKLDEFQTNLESLKSVVQTIFDAPITPTFDTDTPLTLFGALYQKLVTLFSQPITVPIKGEFTGPLGTFTGGGAGEFLAGGGMVRGRGSTTSDSIMAWLSNQEFVVNARAVSHYGADLFSALNAMRLPRDFVSRFSMGGLARSLGGNRFAAGGQVRSGNPVVIKIDRQSFNMTAGDDTIAQLKRFAVTAQLSSSGRKPRWVR